VALPVEWPLPVAMASNGPSLPSLQTAAGPKSDRVERFEAAVQQDRWHEAVMQTGCRGGRHRQTPGCSCWLATGGLG